jgi:hypothetical protein
MPTILGHHDISKGKDHWLASPKREEFFGPLGVTNIRTFVDPQNPSHVALVMDVPILTPSLLRCRAMRPGRRWRTTVSFQRLL